MDLFSEDIFNRLEAEVVTPFRDGDFESLVKTIGNGVIDLHSSIPEKKRISTGIHTVLKVLGDRLYDILDDDSTGIDSSSLFSGAAALFNSLESEIPEKQTAVNEFSPFRVRAAVLRMLCRWGAEQDNPATEVYPFIETEAASDNWENREHTAGFYRLILNNKKDESRKYLLTLSVCDNSLLRRFASETLRPVSDCRWIQKEPEYSLGVLRNMFDESHKYPRTSVGNNLSDLARGNPEMIYGIIEKLAASGNPDSFWIAHRACRNLVKKEPLRVLNILGIDEYKYKDRYFKR